MTKNLKRESSDPRELNKCKSDESVDTLQSIERLSEELSRVNSNRPFASVRLDTPIADADTNDWGDDEPFTSPIQAQSHTKEISIWAEDDDNMEMHLEGKISKNSSEKVTQWSETPDDNDDWGECIDDRKPLTLSLPKSVETNGLELEETSPQKKSSPKRSLKKSKSLAPTCFINDKTEEIALEPSPVKGNRPRSESANAAMHRPRFSSKHDFEISIDTRKKFDTSEKAHARLLQSWQHTTDGLRQKMSLSPDPNTQKCRRALATPKDVKRTSNLRRRPVTGIASRQTDAEKQRRAFLRDIKEVEYLNIINTYVRFNMSR